MTQRLSEMNLRSESNDTIQMYMHVDELMDHLDFLQRGVDERMTEAQELRQAREAERKKTEAHKEYLMARWGEKRRDALLHAHFILIFTH